MPVLDTIDRILVTRFVPAHEIAAAEADCDPFGISDPCPHNGGGPHFYCGSCGDVACMHCAKVVWQ